MFRHFPLTCDLKRCRVMWRSLVYTWVGLCFQGEIWSLIHTCFFSFNLIRSIAFDCIRIERQGVRKLFRLLLDWVSLISLNLFLFSESVFPMDNCRYTFKALTLQIFDFQPSLWFITFNLTFRGTFLLVSFSFQNLLHFSLWWMITLLSSRVILRVMFLLLREGEWSLNHSHFPLSVGTKIIHLIVDSEIEGTSEESLSDKAPSKDSLETLLKPCREVDVSLCIYWGRNRSYIL